MCLSRTSINCKQHNLTLNGTPLCPPLRTFPNLDCLTFIETNNGQPHHNSVEMFLLAPHLSNDSCQLTVVVALDLTGNHFALDPVDASILEDFRLAKLPITVGLPVSP